MKLRRVVNMVAGTLLAPRCLESFVVMPRYNSRRRIALGVTTSPNHHHGVICNPSCGEAVPVKWEEDKKEVEKKRQEARKLAEAAVEGTTSPTAPDVTMGGPHHGVVCEPSCHEAMPIHWEQDLKEHMTKEARELVEIFNKRGAGKEGAPKIIMAQVAPSVRYGFIRWL
jgi:hypothetical protein